MVVSIGSAVEESAFAAVRVRRYGNLCVTFTPELKILAYEFHMVAIDHSYPAGHVHAELRLLRDALLQQQRGAAAATPARPAPRRPRCRPARTRCRRWAGA